MKTEQVTEIFEALSEPKRLRIFRLLLQRTNLTVGEITKQMECSLPSTSQHLKLLESAGLLTRRKQGRSVYYQVNSADRFVRKITSLLS